MLSVVGKYDQVSYRLGGKRRNVRTTCVSIGPNGGPRPNRQRAPTTCGPVGCRPVRFATCRKEATNRRQTGIEEATNKARRAGDSGPLCLDPFPFTQLQFVVQERNSIRILPVCVFRPPYQYRFCIKAKRISESSSPYVATGYVTTLPIWGHLGIVPYGKCAIMPAWRKRQTNSARTSDRRDKRPP